jgi:hypothetical protein
MEFGKFGSIDAKSFGIRLLNWAQVMKKCGFQQINKIVKYEYPLGLVLAEKGGLAILFNEEMVFAGRYSIDLNILIEKVRKILAGFSWGIGNVHAFARKLTVGALK